MTHHRLYVVILPVALVLGCGPDLPGSDDGGSGDNADAPAGQIDAPGGNPIDAGNIYGDADIRRDGGCQSTECVNPINGGCGQTEVCGDGLDNNCDGHVDEGCSCAPGDVKPCFKGPPGRRHVGSCEDGTQTCQGSSEFGQWGDCIGGIWPAGDQCDTQDNDCNGCVDDNPLCCEVVLRCPGPGDLPEAAPFQNYVIDGTMFYSGVVTAWSWTVVGGPCDQLLGNRSFTLTGQNTNRLTFHPTLSGDYTVTVTMVTPDGTYTCTFIVHVKGPGMRVELCWDTTGSADIDLHVHRSGSTAAWFSGNDDCEYANCKAGNYIPPFITGAEWGYASSPLSECSGAPEGLIWTNFVGNCHNPRLDIDNIATVGIPENINVDTPHNGDRFRVMIHYYSGSVTTHPMVNIYCGGNLLGTYGRAPDLLNGFTSGSGRAAGQMWRVVDVTAQVDGNGVTTGCDLQALHPPNQQSGYWLTTNNTTY